MYKRFSLAAGVLCAGFFLLFPAWSDASPDAAAAELTVRRYLDALIIGDVQEIARLMDGERLAQEEQRLQNPTYPQFLRDLYGSARYEILARRVDGDRVIVDVRIILSEQESRFLSFYLSGDSSHSDPAYRITGETTLVKQ